MQSDVTPEDDQTDMLQKPPICQSALQARIVAYSDSDEEDFNLHKWHPGAESDSEEEHKASPVDHDTATVNVKQKQLIRKPPPGDTVSIGAGPGVAAVVGFCGRHLTPELLRVMVPQNAIRVSLASCDTAVSTCSSLLHHGVMNAVQTVARVSRKACLDKHK